ncbi:MAG: polyprenyl synthetase family protein [Rickettsiales bacterium]|nr:polyprenyl synthetase family protein [Rickettsiales bacterium]
MQELFSELQKVEQAVNAKMEALLPEESESRIGENRLIQAMRYSALGSGKRVRPFLVMKSASLFGVSESCALQVAAAIEFVHCFSLIHDDLPALDDDDERRGQPSCHIKFDEATAILAGDALLTLAFEVLSHETTHIDSFVRADLVHAFAKAIGVNGMVGGQMLDIMSENLSLSVEQITRLQRLKTGQLFQVSCEAGAILGKAGKNARNSLRGYASNLGLVFQITDDLLDATTEINDDGTPRKDKSSNKGTYISVMGIEKATQQAKILTEQAISHLAIFGKNADTLKELAHFVLNRTK